MRPHARLVVLAAVHCFIFSGCGENDDIQAPAPMFEAAACDPSLLPQGQDPAHMTCGALTVAENRRQFSGRTIQLAVAILHATGADPEPDPLVALSHDLHCARGRTGGVPFLPLFTASTAGGNAALLTAALGQVALPQLPSGSCAGSSRNCAMTCIAHAGGPVGAACCKSTT